MSFGSEFRAIDGQRVEDMFELLWGPRNTVEQSVANRFVRIELDIANEIPALKALKEAFERHRDGMIRSGIPESTIDATGAGIDIARTVFAAIIAEDEMGSIPPDANM